MKNPIALLVAAGLLWSTVAVGAAGTNDVTGNWTGTLDVGTVKLRLGFKISKDAGGGWTANGNRAAKPCRWSSKRRPNEGGVIRLRFRREKLAVELSVG